MGHPQVDLCKKSFKATSLRLKCAIQRSIITEKESRRDEAQGGFLKYVVDTEGQLKFRVLPPPMFCTNVFDDASVSASIVLLICPLQVLRVGLFVSVFTAAAAAAVTVVADAVVRSGLLWLCGCACRCGGQYDRITFRCGGAQSAALLMAIGLLLGHDAIAFVNYMYLDLAYVTHKKAGVCCVIWLLLRILRRRSSGRFGLRAVLHAAPERHRRQS